MVGTEGRVEKCSFASHEGKNMAIRNVKKEKQVLSLPVTLNFLLHEGAWD
jgi:hypothetical protein